MAIRRIIYAGSAYQTACLGCTNKNLPKRRKDGTSKCKLCGTVIIYQFKGDKVIMTDKKYAHLFQDCRVPKRGRKRKVVADDGEDVLDLPEGKGRERIPDDAP